MLREQVMTERSLTLESSFKCTQIENSEPKVDEAG
jgi:hypothetical protein